MKRCFISAVCICLLACCSCGSTEPAVSVEETTVDPVSEKVSNDISSIGEVTIEDKELIETIEKTYSTLTERQKDGISNYADLLNARDELNRIIKEEETKKAKEEETKKAEEEKKREQQKKEEEQAKQKRYTPRVKLCVQAFVTLEEMLKNPESLQIIEFTYGEMDGYKYIWIDATAQNGFGGATRSIYMVTDNSAYAAASHLSPQTFLYIKESAAADSDGLLSRAKTDGIDHDAVFDLYNEYKQTGDFSILQ